jgi:HEAT repeat protein
VTGIGCSLDLMVVAQDRATMVGMIAREPPVGAAPFHSDAGAGDPPAAGRDSAHALYEHAAGLLASAGALRAATREPGTAAALGPTLACVEASLDALADVAEQLRDHAVEQRSGTGAVRHATGLAGWEVEARFRDFIDALESSRVACAYARVAVGPVQSCARHTRW